MYDKIYHEFFINHEKFTVEDYGDDGFALFCEDSFVCELESDDIRAAQSAAVAYEKRRSW